MGVWSECQDSGLTTWMLGCVDTDAWVPVGACVDSVVGGVG